MSLVKRVAPINGLLSSTQEPRRGLSSVFGPLSGLRLFAFLENIECFSREDALRWATSRVHTVGKGFQMSTGRVKWYNSEKGFGFIAPDEGGMDVFVPAASLEAAGIRRLITGQCVSFDSSGQAGNLFATALAIG